MGAGPAGHELRTAGRLHVLAWPALDALGVDAVVTTRDGGVSRGPYESLNLALHVGDDPGSVLENRRRAGDALGAAPEDLVFAEQVHGREAVVVTAADRGRDSVGPADVLVTATPGPVLVVLVADCVPMVLYDPAARVVAAVHAGWRGTAARVAVAALEAMTALGGRPERVVAGIGPAVSPRTYQVGDEVAAAIRPGCAVTGAATGTGGSVLTADGEGRWLLDLPGANARALRSAGVPAAAIHAAGVATGAGGPFFSDRAARPCGRSGLLVRVHP